MKDKKMRFLEKNSIDINNITNVTKKKFPRFRRKNLRIRSANVKNFFPNFITILALCIGFSSIRFSILGMWHHAVCAILIAAFLDGIDGKIARLMKATSAFGAELDSLCDFVNFGASMSVLVYLFSLRDLNEFGWGISLIFIVSMAARLARFNSSIKNLGSFLVGVPAPFGPIIAAIPIFFDFAFKIHLPPEIFGFFVILSALLMISRFPTISVKKLTFSKKFFIPGIFLLALLVSMILHNFWVVMFILSVAYLLSIPVTIMLWRMESREVTEKD